MQLITPFLVSRRKELKLAHTLYFLLQVFVYCNLCVCQYGGGGGSGGCDGGDCSVVVAVVEVGAQAEV